MDTLAASIDAFMAPLASALSAFVFFAVPLFGEQVPLVVIWLAVGALFFTVYLRFINVRGLWRLGRIPIVFDSTKHTNQRVRS